MNRRWLVILVTFALFAGGVYYLYPRAVPGSKSSASQPATANVWQGDLQVRVSGTGALVSPELPLTFAIPGVLSELSVNVGDFVAKGDALAKLDDRQAAIDLKAAQLNWQALTSPQASGEAEQDFLILQQALVDTQEWLDFLRLGLPLDYYESEMEQALTEYLEIKAELNTARAQNNRRAIARLEKRLDQASLALEAAQTNLEWARTYQPDSLDLAQAQAQVALATARLESQQVLMAVLNGELLPVPEAEYSRNKALLNLERAWLAVEKAQWAYDQATLTAPVLGTVMQVLALPGERVDGDTVLVLSNVEPIQLRLYLDEADVALVSSGDRLEIRLMAYPDQVWEGVVAQIDPALVPVEGELLVQVWGAFLTPPAARLYPGMSLEVDVIAAEASQAVLIPQQALRQEADGAYFVEVMGPDGDFIPQPVLVGIQNLANAQVLSGVQVGDAVLTSR